jgi:GT2 family glycosyltransferase
MARNFSISVIIPNYNGQDLLKKNLPKVFAAVSSYKDGKVEIIVSDDKSTDNSVRILDDLRKKMFTLHPKTNFKVVQSEKNMGFSSSINHGVKNAGGDILVLLNTDVFPKDNFLNSILEHFTDSDVFAVGCMDESTEEGKTILRGRGLGSWKRGFLVHCRGEVNKTNTLWVGGGSGAFRKSIWEKLGGMDYLYDPFYWEDIDLSYRALKSGYKIIFEPKSVVVHEHEKGAIKSAYSDFKVRTIAYRNQFIFVWKNATDLNLHLLHFFWLPFHFVKALIRGDFNFFAGFFLAFLKLPGIIISGFKAQKYFTKSDLEVIRSLV